MQLQAAEHSSTPTGAETGGATGTSGAGDAVGAAAAGGVGGIADASLVRGVADAADGAGGAAVAGLADGAGGTAVALLLPTDAKLVAVEVDAGAEASALEAAAVVKPSLAKSRCKSARE